METMAIGADPLLPPGFRFYPTEEELLSFYLRHRLAGTRPDVERFIPVVDLYSYHPRDLRCNTNNTPVSIEESAMAGAANVNDREQWFFFCPRTRREAHGGRAARTTPSGYWKATGSPSWVFSSSSADHRVIGEKRTMVFYQGRAPSGTKTRWKMNEYKAVDLDAAHPTAAAAISLRLRNEFSVCRVYISTGTLRSFDRRPLNHAGGHDQAAVLHHRQQQQRQLPVLPPAAANTSTTNQQLAAVANDGQTAENSHDSGSSSGSRGMVIDDAGVDDAAAVIDWDALMVPPPADDGLGFSGADDLARAVWPHII